MSSSSLSHYFAAGVFKIDFRAAGYPDLLAIAREWRNDPNFHELVIRSVSDKNFGIQFVYISTDGRTKAIRQYRDQLRGRFGEGLYATDYCEYDSEGHGARPFDGIVELRAASAFSPRN